MSTNPLEAAVRFYEMCPAAQRDFMMRGYVKSEYGTDDDSTVAQCLREIQDYIADRDVHTNGNGHKTLTTDALPANGNEPLVQIEEPKITFFESIALPLAQRGWKVAPCHPHYAIGKNGKSMGKTVNGELVPRPLEMISNDPAVIHAWGLKEPDGNACVYAEQAEGGLLFVDKDGAVSLVEKYERETGKKFPQTLLVCSSIVEDAQGTYSKGHWYFYQTPRTMALEKNIREVDTDGLFSLRLHNQYVASIGSIHPATKKPYTVAWDNPVLPMPDDFLDWLLVQIVKDKPAIDKKSGERRLVPRGQIHGAYVAEACSLLKKGYEHEDVIEMTIKWTLASCEGPIDTDKVRKEAIDCCNRYERGEYEGLTFAQKPAGRGMLPDGTFECEGDRLTHEEEAVVIPAFDRSTMKGIYKEIVDELTRGTTLEPQFIYAISKVVVGAKMAGNVRFADLSVEPLTYLALCGQTGSGKGEAWRRVLRVLSAKDPRSIPLDHPLSVPAGLKVINSADSGAGLRDVFFDPPVEQPILCFIDEVASLGHKAGEKKNPEIIDVMGELANSTSVSRVKAVKGKQRAKNKDNAFLAVVMCGQNSEVFMSSFTGRSNVGWWDRLVPEYGTPQEVGDLPPIDDETAVRLLRKINSLDYSGLMQTAPDAKAILEAYWKSQPTEIRTVARLKQQLKLDTYLEAFGRGSMTAELSDVEDSIKRFDRQMVIRRMMFKGEVPDRVGFYLAGIKELTDWMKKRLAEGMGHAQVAQSWRDYEKKTNARRNNEEHIFARAMETHIKSHLVKVKVKSKNGSSYDRYLPLAEDE